MAPTPSDSPVARVQLLGSPSMSREDGTEEPLPGILATLCAYLALARVPVGREHLAALLWGGVDRERALQSLRQNLTRLRRRLPAGVLEGGDPLRWAQGIVALDVHEFEDAVRRGDADRALSLWRGELLQGVRRPRSWEFGDWIEREIARLRHSLAGVVEARVRGAMSAGHWQEAVGLVQGAVLRLPGEDRLAVLEIEALAAAGRGPEARGALAGLDPEMTADLRARAEAAVDGLPVTASPVPVPPPLPRKEEAGPAGVKESESVTQRRFPTHRRGRMAAFGAAGVVLTAAIVGRPGLPDPIPDRSHAGGAEDAAVLFCTDRATGGEGLQLFRMATNGGDKHRVSPDPVCGAWQLPDGRLIGVMPVETDPGVFRLVRLTPDSLNPIAEWTMEWIRSPVVNVHPPRGGHIDLGGNMVVSAQDSTGQWDLWLVRDAGDSFLRLTDDPAVERNPALDPKSDQGVIVFARHEAAAGDERTLRAGGGDLYTLPRGGGEPVRITFDARVDDQPQVHGDSVLFIRGLGEGDTDGDMEVVLLEMLTGTEFHLTTNSWNDLQVRWSPDGKWACWQSEESGHYESDIVLMNVARREVRTIEGIPGQERGCFFTPDSRGVLFTAVGEGDGDVYVAPVEGGGPPTPLTRMRSRDAAVPSFLR